jgi:hypothetical protein
MGTVMKVKRWSRIDQAFLEGLLWALPGVVLLQVLLQLVRAVRGDALGVSGPVPEELLEPTGLVVGPLSGTVVVEDPTASQYAWAVFPEVLVLVLAVVVSLLLLGVARGLRTGDPFTAASARRLTTLAVVLVVGGTFMPFFQSIAHQGVLDPLLPGGPTSATFELPFWPVFTGMLVFFLAEVFSRGARLREDVEGLV